MAERIPEYERRGPVNPGLAFGLEGPTLRLLWPVFQIHGPEGARRERLVGYFVTAPDADVYISLVSALEKGASNPDGTRRV